jgi:membrane fusion protein, multidrug efflux system
MSDNRSDSSGAPGGTARGAVTDSAAAWKDRLRRPLMIGVPILALVGIAIFWSTTGRYQSTDDAYIQAARVSISSNVAGRVVAIDVHDNQLVRQNDSLFQLDDAPFRIAVQEAEAQLAAARLQIRSLKSVYHQREAEVRAAQDTLNYQQSELARQRRLLGAGISSQAQTDRVAHAVAEANQQLAGARQQLASVLANLGGNADIELDLHPNVQQAIAVLNRARLNLSYTVVRAPSDGIVTQVEQLQVGTYISASMPVFVLVSTRDVWVEANFKEVQLTHMRPGQNATVLIDAYPGRRLRARTVSVSPGTGSTFSLLPPENSTGNWVKVVQRLPVRLEFVDREPALPLYSGLSATVKVDTEYRRWFGRDSATSSATAQK